MDEDKTLKQAIVELTDAVKKKEEEEQNKKINKWIPWKAKVGKRKIKQGYVIVERIINKQRTYERAQNKDGTVMVDNIPRLLTQESLTFYKKKPMITIADNSTMPFNFQSETTKLQELGYGTNGWRIILNRIKNEVIQEKKKFGGMGIWIIVIAVIGLGLLAWKSGWI